MFNDMFSIRLSQLRNEKNVSARDMSLSLGQNPSYINNIETGRTFPSMNGFFYICEYLQITPKDFFDLDAKQPNELNQIYKNLKMLTPKQLSSIAVIVESLANK